MTGRASAELICKAIVIKSPAVFPEPYEGYCGNVIRPDLLDGGIDGVVFETPLGWHVELGRVGINNEEEDTIVRCPEHCEFRMEQVQDGMGRILRNRMYWIDAQ